MSNIKLQSDFSQDENKNDSNQSDFLQSKKSENIKQGLNQCYHFIIKRYERNFDIIKSFLYVMKDDEELNNYYLRENNKDYLKDGSYEIKLNGDYVNIIGNDGNIIYITDKDVMDKNIFIYGYYSEINGDYRGSLSCINHFKNLLNIDKYYKLEIKTDYFCDYNDNNKKNNSYKKYSNYKDVNNKGGGQWWIHT
jgi:hypothetical protein